MSRLEPPRRGGRGGGGGRGEDNDSSSRSGKSDTNNDNLQVRPLKKSVPIKTEVTHYFMKFVMHKSTKYVSNEAC